MVATQLARPFGFVAAPCIVQPETSTPPLAAVAFEPLPTGWPGAIHAAFVRWAKYAGEAYSV